MFFFIRILLLFVVMFGGLALGIEYALKKRTGQTIQKTDSLQVPSPLGMAAMPNFLSQPRNTETGLILSGMVAQNRRDWSGAQHQLGLLNDTYTPSPLMKLRLMTLALGDGNFDRAISVANDLQDNILNNGEKGKDLRNAEAYDLARLVLIAEAFKTGNFENATKITDSFHVGALASFSSPIIKSWIRSVDPKGVFLSDTSGLSSLQAIHEALAAEYAQKNDVAVAIFDRISRQKITPQTAELIAAFYVRQGLKDKATDVLRRTLVTYSDAQSLRDTLTILREDGDYQPPFFADLHMRGPATGLASAFHDFAQIMLMEQATDSSLLFARLATYLDPELPAASYTVGNILAMQEQWDAAINAFDAVLPTDPDYVEAQVKKADILITQKQPDQAITVLESVINGGHEKRAEVYFAIGNLYKDRREYPKALEAFDQAETLGKQENNGVLPDWLWPLYYSRAMTLDLMDRWDDAEKDLLLALEIRPDNPVILNYLGYSYADRGEKLDQADDMIRRAVEQSPNDAYIIDSMGWVLFKRDNIDKAIDYLERAAVIKPYNAVINDHLGDAYWKSGRRLEAQYMWQRAVDYADVEDREDKQAAERAKEKLKTGLVAETK